MPQIATFSPPESEELAKRRGTSVSSFEDFVKQNKQEIEKLKKEFPQATKAGIKDLMFLLWLDEELRGDKKKFFARLRRLLGVLFVSKWRKMLSGFKLISDILGKLRK